MILFSILRLLQLFYFDIYLFHYCSPVIIILFVVVIYILDTILHSTLLLFIISICSIILHWLFISPHYLVYFVYFILHLHLFVYSYIVIHIYITIRYIYFIYIIVLFYFVVHCWIIVLFPVLLHFVAFDTFTHY